MSSLTVPAGTATGQFHRPGGGSFTAHGSRKHTIEELRQGSAAALEYNAFLLDMDGVIWHCGEPVPGARKFLQHLRDSQVPFMLLTNECRYTSRDLANKLEQSVGFRLEPREIYSAANSVRDFFKRLLRHGFQNSAYVIGEEGLVSNVRKAYSVSRKAGLLPEHSGCVYTGDQVDQCFPQHSGKGGSPGSDTPAQMLAPVEYVVVGSVWSENTRDIERAAKCLRAGAKLVYSCPDWYDKYADGALSFGMPMPVVNLLEKTCSVDSYNLGKPNPHMLRMASRVLTKRGVQWKDVLFVGDSIGTDIRTSIENGIDCALVLSGTTTLEKLNRSPLQPNFVFQSIKELSLAFQGKKLPRQSRVSINTDSSEEEEEE